MADINDIELFPIQQEMLDNLYISQTTNTITYNSSNLLNNFLTCTSQNILDAGYYSCIYSDTLHVSHPQEMEATTSDISQLSSVQPVSQQMQEMGYPNVFVDLSSSSSTDPIFAPTFPVLSNPTVSVQDIMSRRFNIVDKNGSGLCKNIAESVEFQFDPIENRFDLLDFS
jgi:hypothetical protein